MHPFLKAHSNLYILLANICNVNDFNVFYGFLSEQNLQITTHWKDPAARWSEEELKHTAAALRRQKERGNFSAATGGAMKRLVLRDDEARAKGSFQRADIHFTVKKNRIRMHAVLSIQLIQIIRR
jgi:hypothetical protein